MMNSNDKLTGNHSEHWLLLWDIFHKARGKELSQRAEFLKDACGADSELRRDIEELLAAEEEAGNFLRTMGAAELDDTIVDPIQESSGEAFSSGQTLANRYQILQHIGRGAMGTVYKAMDLKLFRPVALKFLQLDDPRWIRRFLLEARFQARIEHKNICNVYEVGEIDKKHYIAMQFIGGNPLNEAAHEMSLQQKVHVLHSVCLAVDAANNAGVIHRDLKPANILVTRAQTGVWIPFVTDFGLARELTAPALTSTGMVMGTPWYMSPEQARGEIQKLDRRCDVYGLGATLYQLLCGKPPFEGNSTVEVLSKVINEDPPLLRQRDSQIPVELETIVEQCLQKDPGRRYQTAAALAEDLSRFLAGEPILARPVTWRQRAVKRINKYPVVSALLAVAFLSVIGLSGFTLSTRWRAQEQSRLANEFEQEIRYMEETARHAYTEPLHDVRKEESLVEQRLREIEKKTKQAGRVAVGPGNLAMGRGNMALYRYPEARLHLEKALAQYRIPRVAYALGETLALLYQTELEKAERIPLEKERNEKKIQIEQEFKDPALRYIAEGRSAIEAAEYVEGLIALLDKRYEEALEKTDIAFRRQPWFFEAKKLQADILRAIANDRRNTGDTKAAIDFYKKAESSYKEAVRKGSSYALGYGSLCALGHDWTTLMLYQTGFPDEQVLQNALEACDRSLKVNPDRPQAYIAKAALKSARGSYQMSRGMDPTLSFNESIESARMALKWEDVRFAAYNNMAVAYSRRSGYETMTGKDPGVSLNEAVKNYRLAVAQNPNHPALRSNLGISLAKTAAYERQHGRSIESLQQEAIQAFRESVRIDPTFVSGYNNLGEIYAEKAGIEYEEGRDPGTFAELAIKSLRKASEINPTVFLAYANLGATYNLKARYGIENGLNPQSSLTQAMKHLQKALELNPKSVEAAIESIKTYCIQAEFELNQNGDASSALTDAKGYLAKAEELAAERPDVQRASVELLVLSARLDLQKGLRKQAKEQIRNALQKINLLIKNAPHGNAIDHGTKAACLLLQAKLTSSKAAKQKTLFEAQASYQEAIRMNPHLSRKYASALEEATRLAAL